MGVLVFFGCFGFIVFEELYLDMLFYFVNFVLYIDVFFGDFIW